MTPGSPFPSDEEHVVSLSENGDDSEDARPLGDGFAVRSVGKRSKKSRLLGGPSSRRERFEAARITGEFLRDSESSPRLVEASQVDVPPTGDAEPESGDDSQIEALEAHVDRLSSICEAMWQMMSAELGLTLGRLTEQLSKMDVTVPAMEHLSTDETVCPSCGNTKPADQKLCLFCSARVPLEDTRL